MCMDSLTYITYCNIMQSAATLSTSSPRLSGSKWACHRKLNNISILYLPASEIGVIQCDTSMSPGSPWNSSVILSPLKYFQASPLSSEDNTFLGIPVSAKLFFHHFSMEWARPMSPPGIYGECLAGKEPASWRLSFPQVKKPVNVVLCCSFMFFFGSRPVMWMRKDIWHLNKFKPGSWLHSGWLHAMPYTSKNQTHIYIVLYNKRYLHVTTTLGGLVSATGCNPLARRKVDVVTTD